jgi:curved DNA-binding protein CbpA
MAKDYYAVLGLDRDATDAEIKAVYREVAKSCHPDVAGNDPKKTARFQEVTEAYKVLIDPYRRKMHDRELPMKSYPLRRPTPERIWNEVIEVILLRSDRVGPFQRALQEAKPLALEEDMIILGFSGTSYRSAAYLDVAADQRSLLNALELVVGRKVGYRYIQGDGLADWQRIKAAEERAAARANGAPKAHPIAQNTWDELLARMSRVYRESSRRFPQSRADFYLQALDWMQEAEDKAFAEGEEEGITRGLAKAIERLANLVEVPPTLVAVELARRRDTSREA